MDFQNVTAHAKANVYFDGKVVSHAITTAEGEKKSLGAIQPGSYRFDTVEAERMDVIAGTCQVLIDGETSQQTVKAGEHFDIEANSGFQIEVAEGNCQYVCSYLK